MVATREDGDKDEWELAVVVGGMPISKYKHWKTFPKEEVIHRATCFEEVMREECKEFTHNVFDGMIRLAIEGK